MLPVCVLANFAELYIYRKYQKIDQSCADLKASVFVLIVLSVFGESNGILLATKHFSFDLNSRPPLEKAIQP